MADESAGQPVARFVQSNADRRQIFALVTGDGPALGFGPLTMDQIHEGRYTARAGAGRHPGGDPALGAELTARAADFHDLDDFYRFYGYPPEVIAWIEANPPTDPVEAQRQGWRYGIGRIGEEVAARLGIDVAKLRRAGWDEAVIPGARDPAGDWLYQAGFAGNWAVSNETGEVAVNPKARRFKAWLSLEN